MNKEDLIEVLKWILGISFFGLMIYLGLWAYDFDWRCLIAECRIIK